MISHLKTSLSYTLDHINPLAGHLGIQKNEDDNTISNYEGAGFIHATADLSIEDIVAQPYVRPSIIDSSFPPCYLPLVNRWASKPSLVGNLYFNHKIIYGRSL